MPTRKEKPIELDLKRAVTKILNPLWVEHGIGGTSGHPDGTFQQTKHGEMGTQTCYIELKRFRTSPFRPMQIKEITKLLNTGAKVYMCWMERQFDGKYYPVIAPLLGFKDKKGITHNQALALSDTPIIPDLKRRRF